VGELQERDDLLVEVDLLGRLIWSGGGEDEGAAGDDVFAGEQAKVLAAGDAELVGAVVNLAYEDCRQ